MNTDILNLDKAYEYCEALTKKRESNFSLGFPFLPPEKYRAIHVVYAFCRFVDDVSDESAPQDAAALLAQWQKELANIYAGGEITHPISAALSDVIKQFPIQLEGFQDLIDGCVKDQKVKRYPDFRTLSGYCDLVATSIAKVSLPVYGFEINEAVFPLGRDLSFAFQLTNILRDVAEDLDRGRVYLPQEDLDRFGLTIEEVVRKAKPEAIGELYRFEGERCEAYFKSGVNVLEYLHPDSRSCVHVMWGAYHTLLEKILADPLRSLESQTVLTQEDQKAIVEKFSSC